MEGITSCCGKKVFLRLYISLLIYVCFYKITFSIYLHRCLGIFIGTSICPCHYTTFFLCICRTVAFLFVHIIICLPFLHWYLFLPKAVCLCICLPVAFFFVHLFMCVSTFPITDSVPTQPFTTEAQVYRCLFFFLSLLFSFYYFFFLFFYFLFLPTIITLSLSLSLFCLLFSLSFLLSICVHWWVPWRWHSEDPW